MENAASARRLFNQSYARKYNPAVFAAPVQVKAEPGLPDEAALPGAGGGSGALAYILPIVCIVLGGLGGYKATEPEEKDGANSQNLWGPAAGAVFGLVIYLVLSRFLV